MKKIFVVFAIIFSMLFTGCNSSNNNQTTSLENSKVQDSNSKVTDKENKIVELEWGKYTTNIVIPEELEYVKNTKSVVVIKKTDNIVCAIGMGDNLGENIDIERLNGVAEEYKDTLLSDNIEEQKINNYDIKYIIYKKGDIVRFEGSLFANSDITFSVLIQDKNCDEQELRDLIDDFVNCIESVKVI